MSGWRGTRFERGARFPFRVRLAGLGAIAALAQTVRARLSSLLRPRPAPDPEMMAIDRQIAEARRCHKPTRKLLSAKRELIHSRLREAIK